MAVRQLSVFLENRTGTLCEVTQALSDNGIDVRAITLPCVNPEATSQFAADVAKKLFGEQAVALFPLQMGGEDYSFMMEKVPDSLIAFVGIGNPEKGSDVPHHAGNFQIDEDALPMSAAFYAQYAMDFLNR